MERTGRCSRRLPPPHSPDSGVTRPSALEPRLRSHFSSRERLADMSDVEENNFEGRVSTKPREPSSAAARCSGARGRARSVGARLRGPREWPRWPLRAHPRVPRWLRGPPPCLPRCPASPQRSSLAADRSLAWSYPLLSLPLPSASHLCSEVRVPGALGQEAAGRSLRPDSGRCFLRWHLWPPPPPATAAGSRVGSARGCCPGGHALARD